ncbi:MAG: transcriptional regulator [Lentihominibacter sp.]|nr:transcriptional regulator [Lentihominibacter sp.]
MDYEKIAAELLHIRAEFARIPEHQKINEFARGELFVLNYLLAHEGTAYPKDLSREMKVSSARIAALLNQTEKKGWTMRTADPDDSRQTLITMTEEGHEAIMNRKKEIFDMVVGMLEELGPEDAQELLRIERRIITNQKTKRETGK